MIVALDTVAGTGRAVPTVRLSPTQLRIAQYHDVQRHLLVLAAPGSGKTRAISERVGYLLRDGLAAPEEVLAMTFTERAAAELTDRLASLGQPGVTSGTFHRICAHVLREHGGEIGLGPRLRIFDERHQREALAQAVAEVCDLRLDARIARRLRACISRRKCGNLPLDVAATESPFSVEITGLIDGAYHRVLAVAGALDFDDLIVHTGRLLWDVADVAAQIHRRYRFVFVDEFHDVSPEQYRLLFALAPPTVPGRQVLVVADENQAIFSFRGADATRTLADFRRDYRPVAFELVENYRSAGNIVRAAQRVITAGGASARSATIHPDHHAIAAIRCAGEAAEAKELARLIERARSAGGYAYGDIAVLYRTHARADEAERRLLLAGIPIRRQKPDRFFDRPEVQEALRYLELIAALRDSSFVPALNWPRVLVDELTMIHLRRLAAAEGIGLSELAYRSDLLREQVSPLTRVAIEQFRDTIAAALTPLAGRSIAEIIEPLLACLGQRREPVPRAERVALRDTLDYLGGPLTVPAALLGAAIGARRPIVLQVAGDLDGVIGAAILRDVFDRYLEYPVTIMDLEFGQGERERGESAAGRAYSGLWTPQTPRCSAFGPDCTKPAWRCARMRSSSCSMRC